MYNGQLSQYIFNQLMNGRVINRHKLSNSGQFVNDENYDEIVFNLADYRRQYEMCGYELVCCSDYLYIREKTADSSDLKTDLAMKACLLLLIITKYINEQNYSFTKLTESNGGITHADIEIMQEMPDVQELIEKAKLNTNLHTEIKNVLVNRHIMLVKPSSSTYILSNAGRAFLDMLIKNFN
ncbi:condensin complex protein MksE [Idiomarina abyssalis]|uniref:condensin complex protein MksE n=1 Tax=Idiomarina abyssalis TaxID=86102 RepID=UPI003A8CF180